MEIDQDKENLIKSIPIALRKLARNPDIAALDLTSASIADPRVASLVESHDAHFQYSSLVIFHFGVYYPLFNLLSLVSRRAKRLVVFHKRDYQVHNPLTSSSRN